MGLGEYLSKEYLVRREFCRAASACIGVPYVWGGQDKDYGLDCSGLVVHCLRACGLLGEADDLTCQELADLARPVKRDELKNADLVFYGSSWGALGHVVIHIGTDWAIGASRGNSSIKTPDQARRVKAAVRSLRLDYRTEDRVGYGRLINRRGIDDWQPRPLDLAKIKAARRARG